MLIREPVDRAGAPVDLGIRIALCASRNAKELAIVRFPRFACTLRPRPVRIVGLCALCLWIGGRRRRSLRGLRQVGREQATCGYGAKGKHGSCVHLECLHVQMGSLRLQQTSLARFSRARRTLTPATSPGPLGRGGRRGDDDSGQDGHFLSGRISGGAGDCVKSNMSIRLFASTSRAPSAFSLKRVSMNWRIEPNS